MMKFPQLCSKVNTYVHFLGATQLSQTRTDPDPSLFRHRTAKRHFTKMQRDEDKDKDNKEK